MFTKPFLQSAQATGVSQCSLATDLGESMQINTIEAIEKCATKQKYK